MTPQQFFGNRYQILDRLPALIATHQRYLVQPVNGGGGTQVLSYAEYSRPLPMESLSRQRRIAEVMMLPSFGLLCRVTDYELKPDHQWVVSESAGDSSLRTLLQQRQSLGMDEVEAYLRLLADACEQATQMGWPRLQLEATHLCIDTRVGLPRIPAPDVPTFDSGAGGGMDFDPMATVQFNTAIFRGAASDPVPKDTHDYVLPLARLACDLLGQPQHLRGGNARYQPVPQLNSHQNILLRRALTAEGRGGFTTVKAFMDEFFGTAESEHVAAHTERLRSLTSAPSRPAPPPVSPVQPPPPPPMPVAPPSIPGPGAVAVPKPRAATPRSEVPHGPGAMDSSMSLASAMVTQPVPPPLPKTRPAGARVAMLSVSARDRVMVEAGTTTSRLRLVPDSDQAPIFALSGEDFIVMGRSAGDADYIAQFSPRSNTNDARSRRISRAQTRATFRERRMHLEEFNPANPSVHQDVPIPGTLEVDLPSNFLLAGEYPMEIRAMASDYPEGREVHGWQDPSASPDGRLRGSVVLRAGGGGVLMCEAALLYSDLGIHFSKSGRPWMRADSAAVPVARLHRFAGNFWIEPLESSVVAVAVENEVRSKAHDLILLTDGSKVRLGPYGYTAQAYTLRRDGAQGG